MRSNSNSDNQNIKSTKRLDFLELQIESRNDIENIGKVDILEQYKPEFSWELYNSQISEQVENQQNTMNHEPSPDKNEHTQKQQSQESDIIKQVNKLNENQNEKYPQAKQQPKQQQVEKDKNNYSLDKVSERQFQIFYNKEVSNIIYLKTQVQELLRLTAFSILLEQEQLVKNQIYKLNVQIRKLKIRSISKKRMQKQIKQDDKVRREQRIQHLAESIKNMKLKTSKLGTKLILLNNYLKVKERKPIGRRLLHKRSSSQQVQISKSPIVSCQQILDRSTNKLHKQSQKYMSEYQNSQLLQDCKEAYFPKRTLFKEKGLQPCPINLLKQHIQLIRQNLSDQKLYIRKKLELLEKEKVNLKRQVQFVKFDILKLQNENRRFRAISGNTLRKISTNETTRGVRSLSNKNLVKITRLSRKRGMQKTTGLHETPQVQENQTKLNSKNKLRTEPTRSQASYYQEEGPQKNIFFEGDSNLLIKSSKNRGSARLIQNKNYQSEEIMKQYFNI